MANTFFLRITSADGVFFSGKVSSVIVPELSGDMEILAHHEDMIIALDGGEVRYKPEDQDQWIEAVVGRGFIDITNNRASLVTETCESPENIDKARAEAARDRALERLRQKQSIAEYYQSSAALSRALNRLKAVDRSRHII